MKKANKSKFQLPITNKLRYKEYNDEKLYLLYPF